MSSPALPLPLFLSQTLTTLLPILNDDLPLSLPSTQSTLQSALDDLYLMGRMITSLGVFSENEDVEELGNGEIGFMAVGWVVGEVEGKMGLGGRDDRMACLRRSDVAYNSFLHLLTSYQVLSPEEQAESSAMAEGSRSAPRDPAQRREAKIRQYKREKELREKVSTALPGAPAASSHPAAFLLALLPSSSPAKGSISVNPDSSDTQRTASLLLLRLLHTLTLPALSSNAMELDLLASAPSDPSSSTSTQPDPQSRPRSDPEEDNTWRLDRTASGYKPRELISGGGRVLRPFTILPSTQRMSDRERLKGEVFRSSHRLPTMTIDEYLEEEQRRGNIITGGGQASADAPTSSELLALAAENDGTLRGEEALEEKRAKEENWAVYAEANKKGSGNTMNRG